MSYLYSMKTKGFYPAGEEEQQPYIEAATLPDDRQAISDEDYAAFFNPPDGCYGVFDEAGPYLDG
ncbi:hypothetical protein [Erwinia tracheiphila]|uniref:Uncharacterized protein n=2 Tax=Erwinia tracheiphila TaxID=65700 RepID=A0A345CT33_9GAMM|nr:hypothetical protein [Erwinia tracheiphila]AXF76600.1 hypothetical protein AV903_12020 [Erwinia tracheiphila]